MADEILSYENFDLLIEKDKKGYLSRVIASPAGETTKYNHFTLPFREDELRTFTWLPSYIYRHLRLSKPNEGAGSLNQKSFGRRLFKAVFTKGIDNCLLRSLDATKSGAGLRIRLRISADAPELAELPWEYLYIPDLERFPACSKRTPIVRYIELEQPVPSVTVELPLRILAVTAQPSSVGLLDTKQELRRLEEALANLQQRGLVALERLEGATVSALRQRLRQSQIHILHFIGHGFFDEDLNSGGLIFESEVGQSHPVSAEILGMLLHDHESLRLVFLNACEGARSGSDNTFAGAAQHLVQQGIPAVIAMQFPVSDTAAIALSKEFYQAIGDGAAVDAALTEARIVVRAQGNALEWGTPVLFMRAESGRLFNVENSKKSMKDSYVSANKISTGDVAGNVVAIGGNITIGNDATINADLRQDGSHLQKVKGSFSRTLKDKERTKPNLDILLLKITEHIDTLRNTDELIKHKLVELTNQLFKLLNQTTPEQLEMTIGIVKTTNVFFEEGCSEKPNNELLKTYGQAFLNAGEKFALIMPNISVIVKQIIEIVNE